MRLTAFELGVSPYLLLLIGTDLTPYPQQCFSLGNRLAIVDPQNLLACSWGEAHGLTCPLYTESTPVEL